MWTFKFLLPIRLVLLTCDFASCFRSDGAHKTEMEVDSNGQVTKSEIVASNGTEVDVSSGVLQSGQLLHGRFRLVSFMETFGKHPFFGGMAPGMAPGMGPGMAPGMGPGMEFGMGPPMHHPIGAMPPIGGMGPPMPMGPAGMGPAWGMPPGMGPAWGFSDMGGMHGGMAGQGGKVPDGKPGETFPNGTHFNKSSVSYLGAGQFGDVWKAVDERTGEEVAIKVFYKGGKENPNKQFLTWNTADGHYQDEMRSNILECDLIQEIVTKGERMNSAAAKHICLCKEEYITQGMTNKDSVMYTVWDMCGRNMDSKIRKELSQLPTAQHLEAARVLTRQVVEAINFLNMFGINLIHHDMKADNCVVLGDVNDPSTLFVKLVDFGCYVKAKPEERRAWKKGDPCFMPPEHRRFNAYDNPPSSFDIYGAGLIHMELLCPALKKEDWCLHAQNPHQFQMRMERGQGPPHVDIRDIQRDVRSKCRSVYSSAGDDFELIGKLTAINAADRPSPEDALELPIFQHTIRAASVVMQFKVGDRVEYHTTKEGWVKGRVTSVHEEDGTYDLNLENKEGRRKADPARIRATAVSVTIPNMPTVRAVFQEGDEVEYHSSRTEGKWYACVVDAVKFNAYGAGFYDLRWPADDKRHKPNKVFKTNVAPERVRLRQ